MRPAQRYDDFKLIRITLQAACHGKTEHGIFVKFKKPAKLLSSYLPVSPSWVLRAPGTSLYHLVPKYLRATWPRPEQSHLLPEACSPDGTDKRRQCQRQTERPPPEPSDILKRFYALYDDKLPYYMKKVSKLNCMINPFLPTVPQVKHSILAKIAKKFGQKWVKQGGTSRIRTLETMEPVCSSICSIFGLFKWKLNILRIKRCILNEHLSQHYDMVSEVTTL